MNDHDDSAALALGERVQRSQRQADALVAPGVHVSRQVRCEGVDHEVLRRVLLDESLELVNVVRQEQARGQPVISLHLDEANAVEIRTCGLEPWPNRRRERILRGRDQRQAARAGDAGRLVTSEQTLAEPRIADQQRDATERNASRPAPVDPFPLYSCRGDRNRASLRLREVIHAAASRRRAGFVARITCRTPAVAGSRRS